MRAAASGAVVIPACARRSAMGTKLACTSDTRSKCQEWTSAPTDRATVSSAGSATLDWRRIRVGCKAAMASKSRSSNEPTMRASAAAGVSHHGVRPTMAAPPPRSVTVRVSAGLRETIRAPAWALGLTGAGRSHAAVQASRNKHAIRWMMKVRAGTWSIVRRGYGHFFRPSHPVPR